jgi:hypothetical protein
MRKLLRVAKRHYSGSKKKTVTTDLPLFAY